MTHPEPGRARPECSVVIVAYHRPRSLEPLLAELVDPRIELVVVNVECDADVARLGSTFGATVVDLVGNPGFAAGVNRGVEAATGDVVVVCNDDLRLAAEAALALTARVARGQADVVAPRIVDATGRTEGSVLPPPTLGRLALEWMLLPDQPLLHRSWGVQKWRRPVHAEPVFATTAAVLATRRSLLLENPFPEEYFLYWEEVAWFWRLREAGWRVELDPSIEARHEGGRGVVSETKSRLMARNALRCVRSTQGRIRAFLAYPIVVLWQLRLVLQDAVRGMGIERTRARRAGLKAALTSLAEVLR